MDKLNSSLSDSKTKAALNIVCGSIFDRMSSKPALTTLLGALLASVSVNAGSCATEFRYSETGKIRTSIAKDKPNRITFGKTGIKEVIGDSEKYRVVNDSQGEQIFIVPKAKEGEEIDLTIIAANGKAQDLNLKIVKDSAKTIIIKDVSESQKIKESKLKYDKEAIEMLRAMIENKEDKYEVIRQKRDIDRFIGLSILQDVTYRYASKKLTGARLIVKNTGSEGISLSEEQFKLIFKNIVGVSIGRSQLEPKASTIVYAVTKGSGKK